MGERVGLMSRRATRVSIVMRRHQIDGLRAEWPRGLTARRGRQVAAVAVANKNACIAWRLLSQEAFYDDALAAA
jgi:hypothetical protein